MVLLFTIGIPAKTLAADKLPLKNDMRVSEMDRRLKRAGWKPVTTHFRDYSGSLLHSLGDAGKLFRAGFKGVVSCQGAGSPIDCWFIYRKGRRCITVITAGEYFPGHRDEEYEPYVRFWAKGCRREWFEGDESNDRHWSR